MKKYCFGVDIGGTTVKLGLFELEGIDGKVIDKWEIHTNTENSGQAILPDIAKSIADKIKEKSIDRAAVVGVGVGAPGPITEDGYINKAANLGWNNKFSLVDELSDLTGYTVKAGNDANVAALGEMWQGGGEGYNNIIMVTLGTGVGGGVIINNKILTGITGSSGEIGHIRVNLNETMACGCGGYGCLEQYTSATGIVRLATEKLANSNEPSILRDEKINSKTIFEAVKLGDALAIEVAEEFGEYLGSALANVAAITDTDAFVIGGGVSKAGEVILDYITKYYKKYAFHTIKEKDFRLAKLGNDAGIYGAAKLVL